MLIFKTIHYQIKSAYFVFITFFLAGCATNIPPNYVLPEDESIGIAAGSITIEAKCGVPNWIYRIDVSNVKTNDTYIIKTPLFKQADEKLKNGWPFAIKLPAGQYKITEWIISSHLSSSLPIDISFSVKAGTIAYLGNIHIIETSHIICMAKSAIVSLEDKYKRDIPLIKKRFPGIKGVPVIQAIDLNNKMDSIGGKGNFHRPGPTLPPIGF